MSAGDLFKQGSLQEAIQAQIAEVKAKPGDHAKRLFLFELLVFSGDLERARKHLDIIKYDEMELEAATSAYRRLLDAEEARRKWFADGVQPKFFEDIPEHVDKHLKAVQEIRNNNTEEAARLLNEANAAAPAVKGQLNDKPFEGLRDCDDLLGGVLEVMAQGGYFWAPLEQIESLAMSAPKFPRDLIWVPARLDMRKSGAGEVFLPALYPNSHNEENDQIKLGRATEFTETPPILGKGAKLFLVGDDALPLLEWRELMLDE